ncbi:glutaredoxin family protein [Alkalibacter saccharofermentans]|uniref:Glutaredoxin n=1 Tax=Alkalibacter saccharofermentans DSM 14828 TaxID=1120975 RepID=A0A1M4SA66_9FIRM|nr:glutaredoxin family protein [Alkalibacter saccharofermentans]SHE29106.1 Glutaredoxin [Alkalibacter saccharofermentans DSM 14828]
MANRIHVDGTDKGDILLYALSTCVWCKRTKKLLDTLGIAYDYIDMDNEDKEERARLEEIVEKHNPAVSYPTITIGEDECIIGYKPTEIKRRFE